MSRDQFNRLVSEALDSLPAEFRRRINNVAVLVEDRPAHEPPSAPGEPKRLLLGVFHGVPLTQRSSFQVLLAPSEIVLYQENIEAVCHNDEEVRQQVRRTVIHEFGHYFGMTEQQLEGV
ncbi:MAG TPA: metallopeptidase family protein [Terriglobales bacterium]|nr:metallopeptidase family protein [Terriglobales bacterium]